MYSTVRVFRGSFYARPLSAIAMSSCRLIKLQTSLWVDGRVMEPPEWAEEVNLLNLLFQFLPDITRHPRDQNTVGDV